MYLIAKAMDKFYSDLLCRSVVLFTPADIVQHSFIVQKSILPLNLELCQCYVLWDSLIESIYPSYTYSKKFLDTEEKCRKVLSESRSLLYTLNLDLPRGREWSLKSDSQPNNMKFHPTNPHISKICIDDCFYSDILYSFIDDACYCTAHNLKILKWFMQFDVLERHVFHHLPHHIITYLIDCMHPKLEELDLELVRECFRKLDLIAWVVKSDSLEVSRVTNLLYQFHRIGRNANLIWIDDIGRHAREIWTEEFIDFFLSIQSFQLVGAVLKLKSTPSFSDDLHDFLWEVIYNVRNTVILKRNVWSQQRQILVLQVFWVYLHREENLASASEFLRLIWDSVPDSFISPDEFKEAFERGFSSDEIDAVCQFYSEAVGGLPDFVEPRSLQHYCRTRIRRTLHERQNWLPEGIKQIGLPGKLQRFLNLE